MAAFSSSVTIGTTGYVTMGLAATQGQIPSGSAVQIGPFTTQTDVKNAWSDGSMRFAIVSCHATSTGAQTISVISDPGGTHTPTWPTTTVTFTFRANTDWPYAHGTAVGTGGSTSYWYRFSTVNGSAQESFATPSMAVSGNATLSGTNYIRLQGAVPSTAASVNIYGRATYGSEALMTTQAVTQPSVTSITSSGTTCTVTTGSAHGLSVGDFVDISGCTQTAYNGQFVVATVPTTTTFTYAALSTPAATPATGTPVLTFFTYNDTGAAAPSGSPKSSTTDDPGTVYTATLGSFAGTDTWLNGGVVREARVRVRPVDGSANNLGLIRVLFDMRSYAAGDHRIDVTVENTEDAATMDKIGPYDLALVSGGSTLWTLTQVTSYSYTRFHKRAWTGTGADAQITPDFEPFYQAKMLPRIDTSITERTYDTTTPNYTNTWSGGRPTAADNWYIGQMNPSMAAGGGRGELNFISEWEASYLVNKSQAGRTAVLLNGDVSGVWSLFAAKSDGHLQQLGTDVSSSYWFDVRATSGVRPAAALSADGYFFRGMRASYGISLSDTAGSGVSATLDPVGMEHVPSVNLTPYWLTGDRYYCDQAKLWGAAVIQFAGGGWAQTDTVNFPAWYRGRDGATGNKRLLAGSGMGREFAWPLRAVAAGALACPDSDSDRTYLVETVQNNLQYISDYHDYFLTNGSTVLGGALTAESTAGDWGLATRTMTVTGATNAASSVITTNADHHFATGEYVTLSNGVQYQITVLSTTTFSVPANVSGAGITSAARLTGRKGSLWRTGYTVYVADWILRQPSVWTDPGSAQAWVDKFCTLMILLNVDDSTFVSDPTKFGWYPALATMDGKFVTQWHDTYATMARNLAGSGTYFNSGATDGYTDSNDATVYGGHFLEREFFYRVGLRRSLTNAQSAIDRIRQVTSYVSSRQTSNDNRGYAVEFGSEVD